MAAENTVARYDADRLLTAGQRARLRAVRRDALAREWGPDFLARLQFARWLVRQGRISDWEIPCRIGEEVQ